MISKTEQEINEIRLKIYEETKDLTPAQRAERTNTIAEAAAQKYGFKIIANAKEPFDYTKWQENLYEDFSVEELSAKAMEHRRMKLLEKET